MAERRNRLARWLRSTEVAEPGDGEVVRVAVGSDIHTANVVLAACRSNGLRVQLVDDSITAHQTTVGVSHTLLVFGEDLPRVREILAASKEDGTRG